MCYIRLRLTLSSHPSRHSQVIQPVHDQLLHAFHRVIKLCVSGIPPDITFPHLTRYELGIALRWVEHKRSKTTYRKEVVNDLDLIVDSESSLGEVTEEPNKRVYFQQLGSLREAAKRDSRSKIFGHRFRRTGLHVVQEYLEVETPFSRLSIGFVTWNRRSSSTAWFDPSLRCNKIFDSPGIAVWP
jgi:hypothetical protein